MKIKHAIIAFTFAIFGGLGTIGSLNSTLKEREKANADNELVIRFTNNTDWNVPYVYAYNSDSDKNDNWPGWGMTWSYKNENNQDVYEVTFSKYYRYLIFSNNGSSQLSTVDLNTETNHGFYKSGNSGIGSYALNSKYYFYDYDNSFSGTAYCHYWNEYTSQVGGSTWHGVAMTKETTLAGNGLVYSISLDVKYNSVIFNDNGSKQTGDLKPTTSLAPTNNYCFVYAPTSKISGYNTWWDNINYVYAHNFAQNILNFRNTSTSVQTDTGYCKMGNNYLIAKTTFQSMHTASFPETELRNNFENALPRLEKWAIANGETFDISNGTFASNSLIGLPINSKNDFATIIIVISTLSITALGLFFFLKKRKESK